MSVDARAALALEGVHDYIDHRDIPGQNIWGAFQDEEEIFVSQEVYCEDSV